MAPGIRSLKPYVPAKNFELSKRFYTALGFNMTQGWGGTAENFMFVMEVDDLQAWYQLAQQVQAQAEFKKSVRVKPPEIIDGANVLHVIDPAGVLLVFVQ